MEPSFWLLTNDLEPDIMWVLVVECSEHSAFFGISGRRLTLTVCGESRRKPQTVTNKRPAALVPYRPNSCTTSKNFRTHFLSATNFTN